MTTHIHTEAFNPATGESLGKIPQNTIDDIREAVKRIRIAQVKWSQLSFAERGKFLRKMQRYLVEHGEEVARIISQDNGKTLPDAYMTEVSAAIISFDYYIKHTARVLRPRRVKGSHIFGLYTRNRLQHVPMGVIGIISPWNYPLAIPIHEILMALMSGNGLLYKAASETQMVGGIIQKIIDAGELPKDLFIQVNVPGRVAGDAFLEAGIDKLFFTGSVPIGKKLMAKAAETLTPVSLELGGNDPMIICAEANLKKAANGAIWAGLSNSGQSCAGIERVYVHRDVYKPFLKILRKKVEQLKVGDPAQISSDIGTMTTSRQQEAVRKVLKEAIDQGAVVSALSQIDGETEQALPATILTDVNHQMTVMQEETFGPVLGVMSFKTIEEAIQLANDSDLGLTASVWTKNHRLGRQIASQLQAGVVTINNHLVSHGIPNLPWGGFKQSGIGRTHGEVGLLEMTETRAIVTDYLPLNKQFYWTPVPGFIYRRWVGFVMIVGGTWKFKMKGLLKLIFGFKKTR
ncbi:MAG: aldehyde dehydrogenase family protein [Candidatus Marinimicrobia bacterium]|nr:aldehyde dehydrogenase family protein [Candidatus Neomarinimicrobiota bacterium]